MDSKALGLPPEYQEVPEYFDALNTHDDTVIKNSFLEQVLRNHKVKSVLDLTCGTGSQVFFLAQHGYNVVGSDFSPALVTIARKKSLQEKLSIKFLDGDMRTLHVDSFDAVITMFNAIGHLTKDDFEKALKNIQSNLNDGGLYVFDIFNLEAMTDRVVQQLAMELDQQVNTTKLHLVQYSTLDKEAGLLTSYDHLKIHYNEKPEKIIERSFSLQIYTARELKQILTKNNFELISLHGVDGAPFSQATTQQMLVVAKKNF